MSAWPSPDLRPAGWKLGGHPPLCYLAPSTVPEAPPADRRIERVRDPDALSGWEEVAVAGYPFRDLRGFGPGALLGPQARADPRLGCWLGRVDGEPVAVALSFTAAGLTNVLLVATLPTARGRGYGTAITWAAVEAAPALPTVLLSSDDGRPVDEPMGFVPLLRWTLWYRSR